MESIEQLREVATPLRSSLDRLLSRVGDSRFVLVAEASHGTAEYYTWRAEDAREALRGGDRLLASR